MKIPAIELSEEEKRLFQNNDFVGLANLRCEQIRTMSAPTPAHKERLEKHDREKEEMRQDPRAAMKAAHEAIDFGVDILLRLIKSGLLRHEIVSTDGVDFSNDEAFGCFESRLDYSIRQLVRLAEERVPHSCMHLWGQAKTLTEAFSRIALVQPESFRTVAERSLTMPSMRTRNLDYSADSIAIADAIHLGEKHPVRNISDNRSRAGAACHLLVARIFDRILDERQEYDSECNSLEMMKRNSPESQEYSKMTIVDFVSRWRHPNLVEIMLRCAELPEWPSDTSKWWSDGVLPLVRREFELLVEDPTRNPGLWKELKRGGERDSINDMRRYLEKLCHNKFAQIVKTCPQIPLP